MESSRWVFLSRGAVIFGTVNLVRLIAEAWMAGRGVKATYYFVIAFDILVSLAAIAGGRGLIRGHSRAPNALLFSAGAWFVSSIAMSVWMWPYFMKAIERSQRSSDVILGPRLLFYALVTLACPYAAIVLLKRREPEWPGRGRLAAWLIVGMVGSGVFAGILIARH